jgi:pyruvate/2-oxoglutarate dehydrogenase complex dihydrolipoamide acyltransferase (E2) component
MNKKLVIALALLGSVSACTSVVRGTKQKYPITSQPAGANVLIKRVYATGDKAGQEVKPGKTQSCVTPCFLKLKRGRNITLAISKPGYRTQEVLVESKVTGSGVGTMTAGNFLLGGGIGAIIDASNGSTRSLYPDHVDAVLEAEGQPAAAAAEPAAEPVAPAAPAEAPAPEAPKVDAPAPAAAAPAAEPAPPKGN